MSEKTLAEIWAIGAIIGNSTLCLMAGPLSDISKPLSLMACVIGAFGLVGAIATAPASMKRR
jgi:hypothetical protein